MKKPHVFEANKVQGKIAFIVVKLVEESRENANEEIEKEIYEESTIPWSERVEGVMVVEC